MKLRFIVLFSLVFVCIFLVNCSYAAFSLSTQQEIYDNCSKLASNGVISSNVLSVVYNNIGSSSFSANSDNYFIFVGNGSRYNGGNSGRIQKMVTSPCLYIVQVTGSSVSNFTNDTSNSLYTMWTNSSNGLRIYLSDGSTGWGNYQYNDAVDGFYCYTSVPISTRLLSLGAGEEIGGSYIVYNGPTFEPANTGTIKVIFPNGQFDMFNRLPFSYSGQDSWDLGYLSDFDEVSDIYGYFGPMFYIDDQLYTEGYQNEFSYNKYYGVKNGGLRFDSTTGRISIAKNKLVNKQGYSLYLSFRLTSQDNVVDIGDYYFYAYFLNLSISSGDLMSPDINSNVDISMLNALDEFVDTEGTEIWNFNNFSSGDFISGDWLSGDFLGISYRDYDNWGFTDFVYNWLKSLFSILINHQDITINFGFLGDISSASFKIPSSPFSGLISLFSNGILCLYIIYFMFRLFHSLATFDIDNITESSDDILNWF